MLYAFAFDFRTGDPISFAIKYHSACGLDQGASETFLDWLLFAGSATTICLQYPPSTIAVASLWYTLHLYFGEVGATTQACQLCYIAASFALGAYDLLRYTHLVK